MGQAIKENVEKEMPGVNSGITVAVMMVVVAVATRGAGTGQHQEQQAGVFGSAAHAHTI